MLRRLSAVPTCSRRGEAHPLCEQPHTRRRKNGRPMTTATVGLGHASEARIGCEPGLRSSRLGGARDSSASRRQARGEAAGQRPVEVGVPGAPGPLVIPGAALRPAVLSAPPRTRTTAEMVWPARESGGARGYLSDPAPPVPRPPSYRITGRVLDMARLGFFAVGHSTISMKAQVWPRPSTCESITLAHSPPHRSPRLVPV
jgi:hypothetical protein